MPVKRGRPASSSRQAPARNNARRTTPAAKAKPGPIPRDITQYADKEPTAYHKAFARWILNQVGFNPRELSPLKAFLYGVSIATAARAAFNASEEYEEFRANSGEAKRGPKPGTTRGRKPSRPAPVEEEEEFDDEEIEEDDEDFDADEDEDFDEDSDDDEDSEDDEDFDDEPEPAPVKRGPGRPRKTASASTARSTAGATRGKAPAKKAAPAGRGKPKPADDDDDFIF